ncbi:MAG TPA: hypothetical protein PLS10_08525 [Chitinophagales bacterium]|nr:hypothetical protein [Chitinophagales bacterium]
MKNNYFDRNPIRNWTIAEDCHRIFLETEEKQERWEKIQQREEAKLAPAHIESPKSIKPFVQFNN